MPRIFKLWSLVAGMVVFFAGCASTAHIKKDEHADFSRYRSFAWIEKDESGEVRNDLTQQQIRQAVNRELEKAGWNETRQKPDVLLSYDVLVEKSVEETSDPVYSEPYTRVVYNPYTRRYMTIYYPSQFLGYDRGQRTVREGTVTITMIDAKKDKVVWQGWTTDEVNSRNLTKREIDNSVRAIFRKFDLAKN
ncbi:MAG TPA: DUF4136 domain-containing protein [Chitinophagaceae bacterium]|nr:DUF4136 domain-containing protein [Chitinophagaceae bacterium]